MQVVYVIAAVIAAAWYTVRLVGTQERVRHLTQGRHAERDVADFLDEQRHHGAQILRLIPEERDNVGHVVVCTRGVFLIQTRSSLKPRKKLEMRFDGAQIQIAKRLPDAAPIIQCEAEVELIKALLRDAATKPLKIRAIVVFLNSHVTRTSSALGSEIWVLNPHELRRWIGREPVIMSDADVAMATLHLTQYINRLAA
jgi:hypothetical protein